MKVAPSIMCADLLQLKEQVLFLDRCADMLHIDIMDGHFVRNITLSPLIIQHIRPLTTLLIEAHLMVSDPETIIDSCADAGADIITLHVETCNGRAVRLLNKITDSYGKKAAIAVNPETPLCQYEMLLEYVDMVNFMMIDPGFAGSRFITAVLGKMEQTFRLRQQKGLSFMIQADGSVGADNYCSLRDAGADVIVAGWPTLFKLDKDLPTAWQKMRHFIS